MMRIRGAGDERPGGPRRGKSRGGRSGAGPRPRDERGVSRDEGGRDDTPSRDIGGTGVGR